ncbi:MAG TPA: hypothetical protein VL737_02210, partial [Candidatus Pristimantibacillus sp.]|nr:hypothetical protein [Candidatus Pristimantibacillus sp.]
MKRYLSTIWALAKTLSIRWLRDPMAFFFILVFPLIFLLVLGALSRTNSTSFSVALINDSRAPFAAQVEKEIEHNSVFKFRQAANL